MKLLSWCFHFYLITSHYVSDETINRNRNPVSEISGVFLESESVKFGIISDLTNDSS